MDKENTDQKNIDQEPVDQNNVDQYLLAQYLVNLAWPALIKYAGMDELDYVASMQEWTQHQSASAYLSHADDRLIDSSGAMYSLPEMAGLRARCLKKCLNGNNDCPTPIPIMDRRSLQEIIELVRTHASQQGSCCIAKLSASSIAEAISLIKPLNKS